MAYVDNRAMHQETDRKDVLVGWLCQSLREGDAELVRDTVDIT